MLGWMNAPTLLPVAKYNGSSATGVVMEGRMKQSNLTSLGADLSRLFIPPAVFVDTSLEKSFLIDYSEQNLRQRRLFIIIALILWIAFAYWDYHHRVHHPTIISDSRFAAIITLRILGALAIFVSIARAFSDKFLIEQHASRVIMTTIVAANLCLAGMMSVLPAPLNYEYYFVGVVLVLFFQYGTMALLTWRSLLTTVFTIIILLVQDWIHEPLGIYFFPSMFYLIAFSFLGLAVSVKLERTARERYSQMMVLNSSNQSLKVANRSMRREKKKTDAAFQEMFDSEFKKAQQLSERTEATTRFVRATYHDTMQPLASIATLAHAGAQVPHGGTPPDFASLFKGIATSAKEINLLFKGLRDVFMVGESDPAIEAVSLNQLFDEVEQVYAPQARKKALELRVVRRKNDVRLETDPLLMMRILGNLVSNAIKYTDQGGVLIGSVLAKTMVRIDVIDTGIGIQPAYGQKIFDEFFQVNNPSKNKAMGLGLGLYIVRTFIARLSGHRLSFSSRVARGTRFSIDCPVSDSSLPALPQHHTTIPENLHIDLSGMYVVVVDDDPRVLNSLNYLLGTLNAIVQTAADLSQLDALVERAPDRYPDLLITDFKLSENATGIHVISRLRQHFEWAKIPALVYSAQLALNLIEGLEFTVFVSKSEPPSLLISTIQELVLAGRVANDAPLDERSTPNT